MGATRTPTGTPAFDSASTAASRCRGAQARGTSFRASLLSSELMERCTRAAWRPANSRSKSRCE